jgi:hypothetical protein
MCAPEMVLGSTSSVEGTPFLVGERNRGFPVGRAGSTPPVEETLGNTSEPAVDTCIALEVAGNTTSPAEASSIAQAVDRPEPPLLEAGRRIAVAAVDRGTPAWVEEISLSSEAGVRSSTPTDSPSLSVYLPEPLSKALPSP